MNKNANLEDQTVDLVKAARLQEQRRGAAATYANLFLLLLTLGLFWMQEPGTNHNLSFVLAYAVCQLLATLLYYLLPQWRADWNDPGITAALSPGSTSSTKEDTANFERRLPRSYESLWIAALINLVSVAVLIWWTGGPVSSPFGSVLLLMIVAGQMLVRVGEVRFDGLRDLGRITIEAIRHYGYALMVALSLYAALFIAQSRHSWRHSRVPPAPKGEYLLVIVVNLLATTVLTYASRAGTDRFGESALFPRRAPETDEADKLNEPDDTDDPPPTAS
jgi:hypothetical protein